MENLEIKTQTDKNGAVTVTLSGSLDIYAMAKLDATFNNLLGKKQYKIAIDLSGVDYLGSACAGVFIKAYGVIAENNGKIVLINPQPNVRDVFDLLGISKVFSVVTGNKKLCLPHTSISFWDLLHSSENIHG
ncbi:MAG: STAS domain-containing protein [Planctomycetes bacterium]|nr:STAS domain-containing protein [Planctomycetota bacterium]